MVSEEDSKPLSKSVIKVEYESNEQVRLMKSLCYVLLRYNQGSRTPVRVQDSSGLISYWFFIDESSG